jgi:hypothetical protein
MIEIILKNNLLYEENLIIDNEVFTFVFKWNDRDKSWSFDIKSDDEYVVSGFCLVPYTNILNLVQSPKKPKGYLIVLPSFDNSKEIDEKNLADKFKMFYLTEQDIAEDPFWQNLKIF